MSSGGNGLGGRFIVGVKDQHSSLSWWSARCQGGQLDRGPGLMNRYHPNCPLSAPMYDTIEAAVGWTGTGAIAVQKKEKIRLWRTTAPVTSQSTFKLYLSFLSETLSKNQNGKQQRKRRSSKFEKTITRGNIHLQGVMFGWTWPLMFPNISRLWHSWWWQWRWWVMEIYSVYSGSQDQQILTAGGCPTVPHPPPGARYAMDTFLVPWHHWCTPCKGYLGTVRFPYCQWEGGYKAIHQLHLNIELQILSCTAKCCLTGRSPPWCPQVPPVPSEVPGCDSSHLLSKAL